MVKLQPSKLVMRVRFPPPAFSKASFFLHGGSFILYHVVGLSGVPFFNPQGNARLLLPGSALRHSHPDTFMMNCHGFSLKTRKHSIRQAPIL
jgi:hypothetical protein